MSKPLDNTSTRAPTSIDVAAAVLNAAQLVLRLVRAEVRRQHPVNLFLTQLRALDYLSANPDTSLSAAADYVGLTLPSTSVLIDGLVRRGLVARLAALAPRDRALVARAMTRIASAVAPRGHAARSHGR